MNREANLLGAAALAITDRMAGALAAGGRRWSEPAALIHIRERPGHSIDFMARVLDITHSGAVRLVDRLFSDGLVERREGEDGRSVGLHLTKRGRRAALEALHRRDLTLRSVLSILDKSEQARIVPLIEKLLTGLTEDRRAARHICRLCDFPSCSAAGCPVDQAVIQTLTSR